MHLPTDRYSDGSYQAAHQTWHAEDSPWKAEHIERILLRNAVNPLTVCEVGCGAGEILRDLSLKTEHTQYFGYEISPKAMDLCRTRTSERLHYFQADILKLDVHYDCLLCIDVFEHVEDYFGFLRGIKPKANYKVFHIPLDLSVSSVAREQMMYMRQTFGHLNYFSQQTALATLRDCGYQILDGFFTPTFRQLPGASFRARAAVPLREAMFRISPRWSSRLLGKCSYLVFTK